MNEPRETVRTSPVMGVDRDAAAAHLEAFLRAIGRDPDADEELVDTGRRVTDAFVDELCRGYAIDARLLLREAVIAGIDGRPALVSPLTHPLEASGCSIGHNGLLVRSGGPRLHLKRR